MDKSKLENIYSKAIYAVISGGTEIRFRVGEKSSGIDTLLEENSAGKFAFITAFNPFSKSLSAEENKLRQVELLKTLRAANLRFLQGYGTNEEGTWKREESVFIFDISQENTLRLGRKFQQAAIVFGEKNDKPALLWC